jgi:hypothetical protein
MAGAMAVVLFVVGGAIVWLKPSGDDGPRVVAGQPVTTTTERAVVTAAEPSQVVVIEPSTSAGPGAMVVLDSATGFTIRTLGADYGIYSSNGFQVTPDGLTLYWNRLNEPAQKIELLRQPLDGGPSAVAVPSGSQPRFSSDGQLMVFQGPGNPVGYVRRELNSGADRPLPTPGEAGEFGNVTFQQSQHTLVAVTTKPTTFACPPGGKCPPPIPSPYHGWALEVDSPNATWKPFGTKALWNGATLLGPGPDPGSVLAYWAEPRTSGLPNYRIAEVAADGTAHHEIHISSGYRPVNIDKSGTNILVTSDTTLARVTLTDPTPVRIAGPARLATW